MKILWFEVSVPSRYKDEKSILGGWQDSLERIVKTIPDIKLTIAFESHTRQGIKEIDGVRYIPIELDYTKEEIRKAAKTWDVNAKKLISAMMKIIQEESPDLIHVFGTEWPFGLIAEHTEIPVVIHIQGSIAPFNNALYPPRYGVYDVLKNTGWRPSKMRKVWNNYKKELSREILENRVWKSVNNYMGRTDWDKGLSAVMHPGRNYFHVEEALRTKFITAENVWQIPVGNKIKLLSTGCVSFRKGPDLILKTAYLLKSLGLDFEWNIAGFIPSDIKNIVERKEHLSFDEHNIKFHGFVSEDEVFRMLSETTIFVHTAYAENSPNSICEAQCLGIPVIATNVGGVSSLVEDKTDGILVPANDPWMMAHHIATLASDPKRLKDFSQRSREKAMKRHNDENIKTQLLNCYKELTSQV